MITAWPPFCALPPDSWLILVSRPVALSRVSRLRHNRGMLIVIIAWLYVVVLMSAAETSAIAGIMTFFLYGVLPLAILTYLLNTPARRAKRRRAEAQADPSGMGGVTVPVAAVTGEDSEDIADERAMNDAAADNAASNEPEAVSPVYPVRPHESGPHNG